MTIASATRPARRAAESRMRTEFAVMVPTGGWAFDPNAGRDVEEFALLFITKGRVKSTRTYGNLNQNVGGTTATTVTREWHLPVDSPAIPDGAIVHVTAIDATSDPTLLGARFYVRGPAPGDQSTARRLEITERVS